MLRYRHMRNSRVIVEHLPLVKAMAVQLASAQSVHVDAEDLAGAGMIGLMRAAHNFRRARGVPFGSYAKHRIRGEMLDFIAGGFKHMHQDLIEEAEFELQITGEIARPDPCPRASKDVRRLVAIAVRDLPPQMRGVIAMRFIGEMPHKAVGRTLGLGDSRIWQVQREALARMRRTLRLYQVTKLEDVL